MVYNRKSHPQRFLIFWFLYTGFYCNMNFISEVNQECTVFKTLSAALYGKERILDGNIGDQKTSWSKFCVLNKLTEIFSWMQLHSNADFHFPCFPHSKKLSLNYFPRFPWNSRNFHVLRGIREISKDCIPHFPLFPRFP